MHCTTTYLKTDGGNIIAVIQLEKNRDDDPAVWNIIPRTSCCCGTDSCLTAERGSLESGPFAKVDDAQNWASHKYEEIKGKIAAYRLSKQSARSS